MPKTSDNYVAPELSDAFTGAVDPNRKEIYRDDVMEVEYYPGLSTTQGLDSLVFRGIVCDCFGGNGYSLIRQLENGQTHSYSVAYGGSAVKRREVIGNVRQNPELIESAKL